MKLFTLLHISKFETSTHNNRAKSFIEQIKIYLNCIKLLQNSLISEGLELEILTNDRNFLLEIIDEQFIDISELTFTLPVPSGIKFYSAHFKLEVFKFLSTVNNPYIGLIDNDVVCINEMPECLRNCIADRIPLYYDLSNQVFPAYGQHKILKEKQLISSFNKVGIWAGGEFILGPPSFFKELYNEILNLSETYFSNIKLLHHQGDEFLLSLAIENCMLKRNIIILDAGILNIIGRFWSFPIKHQQRSFSEFSKCFLLHLPNDKKFLSKISMKDSSKKQLLKKIRYELFFMIRLNKIKFFVQKIIYGNFLKFF